MTSIAEKYAAQWMPNGEVSLAYLIQAAVDEATDELRKDVERYRWLREHWFTMTSVYGNNGTVKFQINQTRYSNATEATLDAAIDAAIAQGKGE